ncbi:unnamed protein product [Pieris brassicae]|uniref:Uncharacterized protein n=1 Tax=Pieris brassicae TaxID=7116 RepID=A0A9P0X8H1_PIEBR|nr:unnamed protein product [Pieris brassicae]
MNVGNYKLPVKHRFKNVALSDHLRPHTSIGHERHSTCKQNNWNKNTNTCGWPDTYHYNNPYLSYPTLNKIRPYLNNNNYYSYIPSSSNCIPSTPPPPLMEQVIPGLKHAPATHKDNKHIKPIPLKHTNVKENPELKSSIGKSQKSEITTSKIIEKPYSPPVLPIPTFYDVFEILDGRWDDKSKSLVRSRGQKAVVKEDYVPKKITLVDYLSKKAKERVA